MIKLTWRQLLIFMAYVFAAFAILGIIYTLFRWIQNPEQGQWEPLNVLADNALALISFLISGIAVWGSRKAPDTPIRPAIAPPETLTQDNWQRYRKNLLHNVQTTWIDGFLNNSVHQAVELELGLAYKPDAVSRNFGIVLQQSGQSKGRSKVSLPDLAICCIEQL